LSIGSPREWRDKEGNTVGMRQNEPTLGGGVGPYTQTQIGFARIQFTLAKA